MAKPPQPSTPEPSPENRPALLDLSAYPYLPSPNVTTTEPADYLALVSRAAA